MMLTDSGGAPLFRNRRAVIAQQIVEVITGLEKWWPLTVRQVYYRLVALHGLPNKLSSYKTTSQVLTTLRRHDLVLWAAIEDRGRRSIKHGVDGLQTFVAKQAETFLHPDWYRRCKVQSQPVHIEVSTEKEALSTIFERALADYCVRLNVVRGHLSATMVNQIAGRLVTAHDRGQELLLLHFGDFDPSGVTIPRAMQKNLKRHHGIDARLEMCALTPAQIRRYKLPSDPGAVKRSDPNCRAFLEEFGNDAAAVELDALEPELLIKLIRTSVESHLDMEEVGLQRKLELADEERLRLMRRDVLALLAKKHPDLRLWLPKA